MTDVRAADDAGTGLLGSFAALLAFLAMLLFAVELLFGLYASTAVTTAAHEAARSVAESGVNRDDPLAVAAAEARGERRARQLLGAFGQALELDWTASTRDEVVLRARAPLPRVGVPGLDRVVLRRHVDRTVRVRSERFR